MYLNYSKITFDKDGKIDTPELHLKTMAEKSIGVLSNVSELKFNIKFSELSEMSFTISAFNNGISTPFYDRLTGFKIIDAYPYGIYVTKKPVIIGDGITEKKEITAYSLESIFENKDFFLEGGEEDFQTVWNFYDGVDAGNENTIIGRILSLAPGWSVGEVSSSLIGKYRAMDSYDGQLLDFMYDSAPEIFRCVFVFDTYAKTISAYDVDEERGKLPIYLDFDNLIEEVEVEEIDDDLVTVLSPYGADDLDIRAVNPLGTNKIYDLSFFIDNGDISEELANKWKRWEYQVNIYKEVFRHASTRYSEFIGNILASEAKLTDLKNELEGKKTQQNVIIKALAAGESDTGEEYSEEQLEALKEEIDELNNTINEGETELDELKLQRDIALQEMKGINEMLSFAEYFTESEYAELSSYFIEGELVEDTFVATDVNGISTAEKIDLIEGLGLEPLEPDPAAGADDYTMLYGFGISGMKVEKPYSGNGENPLVEYIFSGDTPGTLEYIQSISYNNPTYTDISQTVTVGKVQNAILSIKTLPDDRENPPYWTNNGRAASFVWTIHLYDLDYDIIGAGDTQKGSSNVTLTIVGKTQITDWEADRPSGGMPGGIGGWIQDRFDSYTRMFNYGDFTTYITTNVTEYQQYSVQQELYDFAQKSLKDMATPTYEFGISSGNFIFAKEFAPFRNNLELGSAVYLRLNENTVITPIVIELEFDFENPDDFSLIFSNRFKRHDNVNTLKDMIESSYSSSRNFDASRYIYNQTAGQASKVSEFMQSSLDAAVNSIIGAKDQSVIIDGAGIQLRDPSSDTELRLVNNMIAMTDNGWQTAKLAIGRFKVGETMYFGVNADVIGGKLIVGNNLIIENTKPGEGGGDDIMQFKVDSNGAWLNNSTMVIQGNGGGILLDPRYGIVAGSGTGTKSFLDISGASVTPSFVGADGEIDFDKDGMPENTNFYLDKDTGNAYFRGTVFAKDGQFSGIVQASDFLNKNGESMLTSDDKIDADYLSLKGLEVKRGNTTTFGVSSDGSVTINGTVIMDEDSSISWDCIYDEPNYIKKTYIDETTIESPTIRGGYIVGGKFFAVDDPNATTSSSGDISGVTRTVIDSSGITTYNSSNQLHGLYSHPSEILTYNDGISLYSKGTQVMKFARSLNDTYIKLTNGHGDECGDIRAVGSNGYLKITSNVGIKFMGGVVDFSDINTVDFTGVNTKGLIAKFG